MSKVTKRDKKLAREIWCDNEFFDAVLEWGRAEPGTEALEWCKRATDRLAVMLAEDREKSHERE